MIRGLFLLLIFTIFSFSPVFSSEKELEEEPSNPIKWTAVGLGLQFTSIMALGINKSEPSFKQFKSSYESIPRKDDDAMVYNWILHPLWGSETYLRGREVGWGIGGSFAFSLAASVTWEYAFESWVEHPSSQDLILTTGIGWMLGELRYQIKKSTKNKTVHWIIDPIKMIVDHVIIGVVKSSDSDTVDVKYVGLRFQF